jgi:hypothetical protein
MFDVVVAAPHPPGREICGRFPVAVFGERDMQISRKNDCDNLYFYGKLKSTHRWRAA